MPSFLSGKGRRESQVQVLPRKATPDASCPLVLARMEPDRQSIIGCTQLRVSQVPLLRVSAHMSCSRPTLCCTRLLLWTLPWLVTLVCCGRVWSVDHVRQLQEAAEQTGQAEWGHWGANPRKYSSWGNHSNRLIPIYTFGIGLEGFKGARSPYRDVQRLQKIYGFLPKGSVNPQAEYFDQTEIFWLQVNAVKAGKKHIVLMIFDGMDWQTTQAAAVVAAGQVGYTSGRGTGLSFQDYAGVPTDYGFVVTSAHSDGEQTDVDAQAVLDAGSGRRGGYSAQLGGATPWATPASDDYLLGKLRQLPHVVTDSACSASSMTSGIKSYNAAINVDPQGKQVVPISRHLQQRGWSIGVVTSVPISHATPAAAYANNVSRNDYQDLSRDLLGVPSVSHRRSPSRASMCCWAAAGVRRATRIKVKGTTSCRATRTCSESDLQAIDVRSGGKYRVVQRTPGRSGREVLIDAARQAYRERTRLLGFFGVTGGKGRKGGHLPYQTADGAFNPTGEKYSPADVSENPTLADMTQAALGMLSANPQGFWLMIEAGDVDWANHSNNVDDAIGAVLSGDAAFRMVVKYIEKRQAWKDTIVIVTADHGHYLVLNDPAALAAGSPQVAGMGAAATSK